MKHEIKYGPYTNHIHEPFIVTKLVGKVKGLEEKPFLLESVVEAFEQGITADEFWEYTDQPHPWSL